MKQRNKLILALLTALVIAVAIFSSFGFPLFSGGMPQVVLPTLTPVAESPIGSDDPDQSGSLVQVAVTPQTVQNVIDTLERWTSYSRTVTVTVTAGGQSRDFVSQVWVDQGWTRVDMALPTGSVETQHTILGEGTLYRWYGNSGDVASWAAEDLAQADLAQRIPTYRDILELDVADITAADYVDLNGTPCVYVETVQRELGYIERFWVAEQSGLLIQCETVKGEETILKMTSSAINALSLQEMDFSLPDGTILHQSGGG